MLTGPLVILCLKIAVVAVTVLLLASLAALAAGKQRLHGRINMAFFGLTVAALVVFEVVIRFIDPLIFDYINDHPQLREALTRHLYFAVPSALMMPVMLWTGLKGKRTLHIALGILFGIVWAGTFVTGVFTLPHVQ
jgi:hypothetical protein